MKSVLTLTFQRAVLALRTVPNDGQGYAKVLAITALTTLSAGGLSVATGFIDPVQDFSPPSNKNLFKPLSAFVFPSLIEELFWRGMLLPHPSSLASLTSPLVLRRAGAILLLHVAFHPVAGRTIWPRGRDIFMDPRFLLLATIVLGGATASYLISGGSVWAAALTHGLPVALWRDFFQGESKLRPHENHGKHS